ncbi:unnamed protein product [Somion occarium]|uniref:DNA2/NAM7 helicase-like C-terminal domain-containing protein n=1 Tax=Somion occarium TaxID=3059160 RepID=A0ABP1E8I7_9APHY
MAKPTRFIEQNMLDVYYPKIFLQNILETELSDALLDLFLEGTPAPRSLGVAAAYTEKGKLAVLAIAAGKQVVLIEFRSSTNEHTIVARQLLQDRLLCSEYNTVYAFDIAPIALALFADRGVRLINGVDFQSVCPGGSSNRDPAIAIESLMTTERSSTFHPRNTRAIFAESLWDTSNRNCETFLALRAWSASFFAKLDGDAEEKFRGVPRVNTMNISDLDLQVLAKQSRGDQRLDGQKNPAVKHDFVKPRIMDENGRKAKVILTRFQTRMLRPQSGSHLCLLLQNERGEQYEVHGRISDVSGQQATIELRNPHNFFAKEILSITSVGQNGPTSADLANASKVLEILQGKYTLSTNPFLQTIWPVPDQEVEWPSTFHCFHAPPILSTPHHSLNESQEQAVLHMLSQTNDRHISIIQGPPGTGKTSVIATYVLSATAAGQGGIWLVAQSNVAVKNIAEKLIAVGFDNWKLLVSRDFQEDWHEHLYHRIARNVIRSDQFYQGCKDLAGCRVILCTLSMLSHPRITLFTSPIPIRSLVVDEASQINVSQYMHPLSTFPTIHKLCFIGDDKQLPPYGQEEIEEIQSIFEVIHLRSTALFLDMQYRMPSQIGNFISDAVYDGQLRSNPEHPNANDFSAFFIHVKDSTELQHGTSYQNPAEIATIIKIARKLQEDGESFKIITPYEAQKSMLENGLRGAGLVWQNKCFAVDSFQGNEEDVIVLSLVRTKELGFLQDLRRTNVMLTRCKKFLFTVSSWDFLVNGPGANSLVGRMAASCGDDSWIWPDDIDSGNY